MEIFWYFIIVAVLTIFFVLDGYDFGTGIMHLFHAKEEKDKEVVKLDEKTGLYSMRHHLCGRR